MSAPLWFIFFLAKYLCLFSLKSIVLGIFLLTCRFSVSVLIRVYSISWYSLIFFLVYIGGLLVLFIYISSLKFKPVFYFSDINFISKSFLKANIIIMLLLALTQVTWKLHRFSWERLDENNFRLKLFKESEIIFLINIGLLLLAVLWVIAKLSFRSRGALRPLY